MRQTNWCIGQTNARTDLHSLSIVCPLFVAAIRVRPVVTLQGLTTMSFLFRMRERPSSFVCATSLSYVFNNVHRFKVHYKDFQRPERDRKDRSFFARSTALAWRVLTAIDFFREKLNRFCYAQAVTINVWRLFVQISYGEQVLRPHTVYTIGSQYIVTSNSFLDMDQEC